MINSEEKKRQIYSASRSVRYSDVPVSERQQKIYNLVFDFARRRGYSIEVEAFKVHAKSFDESMMSEFSSMPWQEIQLALNWGFVLEEFGEYDRIHAQNMTRVVRKYAALDERKSVLGMLQRERERKSELDEWQVNLKNWNVNWNTAKNAWDKYVSDGSVGDYRSKEKNSFDEYDRLTMRHMLSGAYNFLKDNNIIFESPSRRRKCEATAEKEGRGDSVEKKAYTDSLLLEWEYLEAVKSGRDIGAKIDELSKRTSDSERIKIISPKC